MSRLVADRSFSDGVVGEAKMRTPLIDRLKPDLTSARVVITPALVSDPCVSILNRLRNDSTLAVVPVVDLAHKPCAMIERHLFIELFVQPFTLALYGREAISRLVETTGACDRQPIVFEASTSIEHFVRLLMDSGRMPPTGNIIITESERYCGVVKVYDLLLQLVQFEAEKLFSLCGHDAQSFHRVGQLLKVLRRWH